MTQVSRKGFRDKNGKQVVIVPNIPGATAGNLASFDAEGNLQDSGKKPADFVPNVPSATSGNLASFDAEGNLQDSGKKASDFAPASHVHELIKGEGTGTNAGDSAAVVAGANTIDIEIEKSGVLYNAEINTTNFANLLRALQDPAAPASEGNALITNGLVYAALAGKSNVVHTHLPKDVTGLIPEFISFYSGTIDLDDHIDTNASGMKRLVIQNKDSSDVKPLSVLTSGAGIHIHENSFTNTAFISSGDYALITVYFITGGQIHEHESCYLVSLDGIFVESNQ